MRALRVGLRDFRSYERADVELGPGLTVVVGPNGAGKTNLLEGTYFALTARSCRSSNEREVVRIGWGLMEARAAAAEQLAEPFARFAAELGLPEPATLAYRPRSHADGPDGLRAELLERRAADVQRGFTAHGPHRDELQLAHGGRALRAFGSQGQQRVALLALLLAEREILLARHDRAPLMLLDDVMSELDAERRLRLAELLRGGGQALVTATEVEHVPGAGEAGVVTIAVDAGALAGAAV